MKRELAFALEAQSELNCGSLGRTRSSKPLFSKPDVVLSAGDDAVGATTTTSQCNGRGRGGINVYKRNKRLKSENPVEEAVNNAGDDLSATPDVAKIRVGNPRRFTRSALKDLGGDSKLSKKDDVALVETLEPTVCDVVLEPTPARKRFTRSALKHVEEESKEKEKEKDFGELKLNGGGVLALVETLQPAVGEVAMESGDMKLNGGSDLALVETLRPVVGEVAFEFGDLKLNDGSDLALVETLRPAVGEVALESGDLKLNGSIDLALVETSQPAVGEVALESRDLKLNGGIDLALVETLQPAVGEVELEFGSLKSNGGGDVTLEGTDAPRRFTRSALKPAVTVEGELEVEDDGGEVEDENLTETPTEKFELKMSKKIVLTGRITTVRELLETGLLEGLPVFYHGIAKDKEGIKLRGVIRGVGILCTCSLCKGSKVITPSQFEIHACKSYRRASQYICLENGKNLLQLLDICKRSAKKTLEETIQTVTGPLPAKESNICQNCKGLFPLLSSMGICYVCKSSMDMEAGPTPETAENVRTPKRGLVCQPPSASATLPITSPKNNQQKRKRNCLEAALTPTSSRSASQCNVPQEKERKMTKKSSRSDPKSPGTASVRSLSHIKRQKKLTKGLSKSASVPKSIKSANVCTSSQKKNQWRITKKDQNMHHVVFEEGGLPDGSEVAYYSRGQKLLEGYKKGLGIFCFCCNTEVSASQFEAHAGWASRKKPYQNIYVSNGVSLHEYAVSLLKHRTSVTKDNDDLCIICADGGDLLLCDGCPRAFHKECASLASIPRGKWYCRYCENMFQREKFVEHNANAIAAGRVSGVDPIAEITKRCIRIVKNPESAAVSCMLCRGYEFSKGIFGPTTVILCDQCEKEYHVGCLKTHKMANLKKLPKREWYCSINCKKMHSILTNLVTSEPQLLQDTLMDLIRKKQSNSGLYGITDFGMRWRLLSGKVASRETKPLLSEAIAIFHECFDPIIDAESGKDFIPSMVYGGDIKGQDFRGMYSAVLTVNSAVVSAGILRIFGQDMAELPLVATSKCNQGKGYFQVLFSCIEKMLISLNVKKIVLPSADEAEAIWINKFGFRKLSPKQLADYRKTCSAMLIFQGTSMLEKVISKCEAVLPGASDPDLSVAVVD